MDKVVLFLSKIGTILVDRRFLQSAGTILLLLFGIPEGKYTEEITQVGILLTNLALVLSWTIRPPSGLKFKELLEFKTILDVFGAVGSEQTK